MSEVLRITQEYFEAYILINKESGWAELKNIQSYKRNVECKQTRNFKGWCLQS